MSTEIQKSENKSTALENRQVITPRYTVEKKDHSYSPLGNWKYYPSYTDATLPSVPSGERPPATEAAGTGSLEYTCGGVWGVPNSPLKYTFTVTSVLR